MKKLYGIILIFITFVTLASPTYSKDSKAEKKYLEQGWKNLSISIVKARAEFEKVLKINSKNDEAINGLGHCSLNEGNYEDAYFLFKKAITINPKNYGHYSGLSLASDALSENDSSKEKEAEWASKKACELAPKNMKALYCN